MSLKKYLDFDQGSEDSSKSDDQDRSNSLFDSKWSEAVSKQENYVEINFSVSKIVPASQAEEQTQAKEKEDKEKEEEKKFFHSYILSPYNMARKSTITRSVQRIEPFDCKKNSF